MSEPRKVLVSENLATAATFERDVRALLGLSDSALRGLAELGDSEEGFHESYAAAFAAKHSIPTSEASLIIRGVRFLYGRVMENRLDAATAASELIAFAADRGIPVGDLDKKSELLRSLLLPKPLFEANGWARHQVTNGYSHYIGVVPLWDLRPVWNRISQEVTKTVPVLSLTISYHDDVGTNKTCEIRLTEEDWSDLLTSLEDAESDRRKLNAFVSRQVGES